MRYKLNDEKNLVIDNVLFPVTLDKEFITPDMERIFNYYETYYNNVLNFSKPLVPFTRDEMFDIVAELMNDSYYNATRMRESFKRYNGSMAQFIVSQLDEGVRCKLNS